ncbi:nucleophile aminohydrolase [Gloeopeniophorella convolvens]|nr:nucleophile aminohydrolase [Gloeopeniophorella convolvens]
MAAITPSSISGRTPSYIVAIHGGAGYHSPSDDTDVKRSLRAAISSVLPSAATTTIAPPPPALDTAESLLAALEDAPAFNAGYGANLTLAGHAECDAALMSGADGTFGAVGALRGVRHPARAARAVLEARRGARVLGRVPPLLLVSEGAARFAEERGVRVVQAGGAEEEREMVAPRARAEWARWKARLDAAAGDRDADARELHARQDTVGAVVLREPGGDVAAGVSSGGLLLKAPGRVGEAAVFGAGCWAERAGNGVRVACSVSGEGELIIQSALARTLAERVVAGAAAGDTHEVLRSVLVDGFYDKWRARGESQPAAGVLLVTQGADGDADTVRLWCAFTTQSMAVAYASSRQPKPKVGHLLISSSLPS